MSCEATPFKGFCSKDPADVEDYFFNWSERMTADADAIATSTWTADPGITIVTSTFTTTRTVVSLSGGTDGTKYRVYNTITTTGGRTVKRSALITVKAR